MEFADEEDVHTQRFDVTIIWPTESETSLTDNEVQQVVEALAKDLDEDVVVEVEEIVEPAY